MARQSELFLHELESEQVQRLVKIARTSRDRVRLRRAGIVLSSFQGRSAAEIGAGFVMSRLLWQLGVGELANLQRDGWTLLGQGDHVLWPQARGVHEARRWSLNRRLGSR